jgi:glutathione S-transferase
MRYVTLRAPEARLWPAGTVEDSLCSEWLAWISSTIHPAFAHLRRPYRYGDGEAVQAAISEKGRETSLDFWRDIDGKLAGRNFAVGDNYSVADAYLMVLFHWGRTGLEFDMAKDLPNWSAHARRVARRPAVQRVLEVEEISLP